MKHHTRYFVFCSMLILTLFGSISVAAQPPIFVDNFSYSTGALLSENGWTAHSGTGTNPIAVVTPGLTYPGYPGSGVGNAAGVGTTGEDVHRVFSVQSSGAVYAAFLVNVTAASTDPLGGYFFHLSPDPIGTNFRVRVFAKRDEANGVAFGLSKALTTAGNIAFTPFTYSLNTTYLIVAKYTFVDGAANDTVTLYINPTLPGGEPGAPTLTATDVAQSDIAIGSVALRQGTASSHPTTVVDGLRIGTSWASVTTASAAPTQNVLDFNGDGRTDFAVVRNIGSGGSGATNQIRWFTSLNGSGTTTATDWGVATDTFVPVDYDGDNITDIAVWRAFGTGQPSGNVFFYSLQSNGNTLRVEDFGQTDDNPKVVADYDGDGKADVAVYRPGPTSLTQSTWYYRGSLNNPSGSITFVPWGVNGDFVAPGDYDGDGRADFAIQRNNGGGQGIFWLNQTTDGVTFHVFGTPSDVIVPGDYDGDGKTDIAVIRGAAGQIVWYVRPSSTGVITATAYAIFGVSATDFPSQGDYDGDGKTDVAIWRPSATPGSSAFWVSGSTSGVFSVPFGANGDYPVANYNAH